MLFYVNIYGSYKLLKTIRFFGAPCSCESCPLPRSCLRACSASSVANRTRGKRMNIFVLNKHPFTHKYTHRRSIHTVSQKKLCKIFFCQNFVKFPPILMIFGTKMGKRLQLCMMHSFSTSSNLRHHTTVLNANVRNCYITL